MTNTKWYQDGLKFQCTRCGQCCSDHDEYAYVYLVQSDINNLAAHKNLNSKEFIQQYCRIEDGLVHLKTTGPDCIFLTNKHCDVFPVRPLQCRTWPFWSDNLEKETWEKEAVPFCPGIGSGRHYNADEIDEIAAQADEEYDISDQ